MSQTTTNENFASKEDAKQFIKDYIVQEEQIVKIEITKNGGNYAGSVTVIDPPAPPAGTS
ncbi:hypothetical protein SAMN05444159_4994 [Bradyrhizobium lablabi]|uniref:Uncharacterized protein n=1 Tax=Bradyrhizobium lablabi TaxID=722472 RepID=A0A1M6XW80_9BRAD|nr:hypothetical protein [Bradyrhizobium lablabi]SHL10139.1 hypothetical protein SAMN05444159_4994 [Bradyrhizobium lablabi]